MSTTPKNSDILNKRQGLNKNVSTVFNMLND